MIYGMEYVIWLHSKSTIRFYVLCYTYVFVVIKC